MTRWNLKAAIFVLLAIAINHVHAQTQEPAPENKPAVISHACATPRQPQNLKLASYVPVHCMSATGQALHLKASAKKDEHIESLEGVPAANSASMTTALETVAPGLNTTAGSTPTSDPITKEALHYNDLCGEDAMLMKQSFCYPWAVNFGFNLLAPLTTEELRIPQPHDDQPVASKKLPEPDTSDEATTSDPASEPQTQVAEFRSENSDEAGVVMNFSSVRDAQFQQNEIESREDVETAAVEANERSSTAEYRSGEVFNFSDSDETSLAESTLDPNDVTPLPNLSTEFNSVIEPTMPSGIIVHPPLIQPYNRNQHTFVVENRSEQESKDVTVEISVPEYAKVIATLPDNSVFSKNKALFKFEKIAAGDKIQVHINAISTSDKPVEFVAHVVARNVFEFATEQSVNGELTDVSYGVKTAEAPQRISEKLDNGAQRVRNPYIKSNSRSVYR